MTLEASSSQADVLRLCKLAGLPRATYYRHLARRGEEADECELRDLIQRICLKHRFYGYRRVTARHGGEWQESSAAYARGQSPGPAQSTVPEATCRSALDLSHRSQSGARPCAVSA